MADRFINWPPPVEALKPLARALARAAAERDFKRGQEFLRSGRHLRRTFSPADDGGADDRQPPDEVDSPSYQHGREGCRTAFVLSAPGQDEQKRGHPAAGRTGETLDGLLRRLHAADPARFPFLSRRDYRIVNAVTTILYKAKSKRTEGKLSELMSPDNLARLRAELAGMSWIVALGDKAQLALRHAGIEPTLCGPHPSLQRLNTLYKVDAGTSEAAREARLDRYALDVLAGCPARSPRDPHALAPQA